MKIAVLHSGDLQGISPGGVDSYVKNFIAALPAGDEVTVFGVCPAASGMVAGQTVSREYRGRRYWFVPLIDDSRYPLSPRYAVRLLRLRRQLARFDVVYAQRVEYALPLAFSRAAKKLVQIVHGTSKFRTLQPRSLRHTLALLAERLSVAIAKRTFVVVLRDDAGLAYYRSRYPRQADRFEYVRIPVDINVVRVAAASFSAAALRSSLGVSPSDFLVVFAGRVNDAMGKRVLLYPEMALRLPADVKFVIVGDGPALAQLRAKSEKLGVADRIICAGYVGDRARVSEFFAAADASINVSVSEGTCTSVLESLAVGVPVVSTDTGDVAQVLRDGKNGVIVPTFPDTAVVDGAVQAILRLRERGCEVDDAVEAYELRRAIAEQRKKLAAAVGYSAVQDE